MIHPRSFPRGTIYIPTVSRWERADAPLGMKPTAEKLLRLMALVGDAVKEYPLEEMATEKPTPNRIRLHATRAGWAPKLAAAC